LLPLKKKLEAEPEIALKLIVTGSHLSAAFGNTLKEIEDSAIPVFAKLPIPIDGDSKADMGLATSAALSAFSRFFLENRPDLLVVLGDRYEIFGAVSAAAMLGIPIAHLHGGETTEGAVDEFLRHSITKMSTLHFTACEEYRRRVIQLGEHPDRVFNVGALGVENILQLNPMTLEELEQSLQFSLAGQPFSVVTFHPVTLEENTSEIQLRELIAAMDAFPDMRYIVTLANADAGGQAINQIWHEEAITHPNWLVIPSLGAKRYLSALRYAKMMIGNSSSGILEAPAMHLPTVNIGDRQKGRMMAESVLCCAPERTAIVQAMKTALSEPHQELCRAIKAPFGDGTTSEQIVHHVLAFLGSARDTKKEFYDIPFEV